MKVAFAFLNRITTFATDINLKREISASHTLRKPKHRVPFYSRGSVYFILTDDGLTAL